MTEALKIKSLYDRDFYAWTQDQAAKLRARASLDNEGEIDWENAAEEIESLGRSDKREIRNRMRVLLAHLLKWQFQAAKRKNGWRSTIVDQRQGLMVLIDESPSLRLLPGQILDSVYDLARVSASVETGLAPSAFPPTCPYAVDDLLDMEFYPGAEAAA